jgi:hypothetical protein
LLIGLAHYPVSMIGVPGQTVQNTSPPTVAMLAFACAQAGVAAAVAPLLNALLHPMVVRRVLSTANSNVMGLYLWHMVPVIVVALVGYPSGLLPQPIEGTGAWWLARLEWVVVLCVITAVEMALLWRQRRFFTAPLPMFGMRLARRRCAEPLVLAGAAMAAYGLWFLAADGFAPAGRFAWMPALVFAGGLVLVALRPGSGQPAIASVMTNCRSNSLCKGNRARINDFS